MPKRFALRQLFRLMCAGGVLGLSATAMASGFQLWEQDGASVANYHAGRVALAEDASIAFYNPAGMTRIKNQQIVFGDVAILLDAQYSGTVSVNTVLSGTPQYAVAQGGSFSQVPNFHYVAPINDSLRFGLSLAAPFGLRTAYGENTVLRYVATTTQMQTVDLSPSIGVSINKKLSVGFGIDAQRMSAEFDQVAGLGLGHDTLGTNKGHDIAYGYHLGTLYQFTPTTRVGLTYNSQVAHHFRGNSKFVGPIADSFIASGTDPALFYSDYTNAAITLPPYTTLSGYHQVNDRWAVMGTAIYTQWNVLQKNITLRNVAGIDAGSDPSNTIVISLPQNYHNTWNFSVGADFFATDKMILRGGLGYDKTPTSDRYRVIEIPDNDRYAVAFGGHYQATKTLGFDLGWTHLFLKSNTPISPPVQVSGLQRSATNGSMKGSADVFGAQLTWDIA